MAKATFKTANAIIISISTQYVNYSSWGNNIGNTNTGHLFRIIKRDFCYISRLLPDFEIVWSDILPRFEWHHTGTASVEQLDIKYKRISGHGRKVLYSFCNGRYISHDISKASPDLFGDDGVRLSNVGNDIFLNTLHGSIDSLRQNPLLKGFPCTLLVRIGAKLVLHPNL